MFQSIFLLENGALHLEKLKKYIFTTNRTPFYGFESNIRITKYDATNQSKSTLYFVLFNTPDFFKGHFGIKNN